MEDLTQRRKDANGAVTKKIKGVENHPRESSDISRRNAAWQRVRPLRREKTRQPAPITPLDRPASSATANGTQALRLENSAT